VLRRRLSANGQPCPAYLLRLESGPKAELAALSTELTVGETYFLRHIEQFQALVEKVVPERLALPGRSDRLRLLSAGCSSGEEAYSMAIMLRESGLGADASIVGVDVNPAVLEKARRGRYTDWSLRSVPEQIRRRWFTPVGNDVQLDPSIRDQVKFQHRNLITDDPGLWRPNSYDVVFSRNVLMYFAPELMVQAIARIATALAPGGYLFLGSAETLRGVSSEFRLCESHGTFYYQRLPEVIARPVLTVQPNLIPAARVQAEPVHPAGDRYVQGDLLQDVDPAEAHAVPRSDLDLALDRLRQERFAEALPILDRIPRSDRDPELLLLRAAALTHCGRFADAGQTARRLLMIDRACADAEALLAICSESESDLPAAIGHCRSAIGLDPRFALAHLQLARLTQRTGDPAGARREYSTTARLLPDETDRRILLFAGGFDREALISLCRTQHAGNAGNRGER
jgi:chemotaxis protein methyltransferase CheR